jgi:hypothetical protein
VADETPVDLVFLDYNMKKLIPALNSVQTQKYEEKDVLMKYTDIRTWDVLGKYAEKKWKN